MAFLSKPFNSSSWPMSAQKAMISAEYFSLSQETNTEVSKPPEYANTIFTAAACFKRAFSAKCKNTVHHRKRGRIDSGRIA